MFGWSPITIIIILVIVFLIFGAGKLPEIGSGLGKALKNFKNSVSGKDEIDVTPDDSENDESTVKRKKKQIARTSTASSSAKKVKKTDSKTVKTTKKA
ncbi:MAG: twin-arginine translocase TatA/TatE family subunit [bacterium]|jgi:sec-independent protein translocase protein TatA